MQELTDDQLDGLFRKSAEEFEPEFEAGAWQAMQQQLNNRDRELFWAKLVRWGIPVLALFLVTGIGWYVYENRSPKPVAVVVSQAELPPTLSSETKGATQLSRSARLSHSQLPTPVVSVQPAPSTDGVTTTPGPLLSNVSRSERAKRASRSAVTLNSNAGLAPTDIPTSTPALSGSPVARLASRTRSRQVISHRETAATRIVKTELIALISQNPVMSQRNSDSASLDQLLPETVLPVTLPGLTTLAGKPATWPSADTLSQHEISRPAVEAPVVTASVQQTGLSVRLLVSPDLSSVGLRDFQRPGTSIGALLEYQFATRWRIQAGVLRSVKVYESPAARYEWSGYTWAVQPESVYGRCNMLDIPLNLRYDFSLRPRPDGRQNRWFVTAGVTTYVMLREDYTYNYANPDDPRINDRARAWRTNSGSYGFSHLNVSTGYERAFSKRLSWQIEPFVKVPLKGVGYYKLNLMSTGAFFSLRYKLR